MKKFILTPFICLFIGILTGIIYGHYSDIQLTTQLTKLEFFPLLSHNLKVSLFIFIGGILTLSILNLSIIILNGFSLGVALSALITKYKFLFILKYLIIHGSLELLSYVCISIGSLILTYYIFKYIESNIKHIEFNLIHKNGYLKKAIFWSSLGIILLTIAAIIEVAII